MTIDVPTESLNYKASRLVRATLAQLRPPPEIPLAECIEAHVQLPEGLSAMPGRMRSRSGKFSIRSTGAAGHDVAADASNTHRRMARFDDLRISSTECWSGLGASPPSTRSCTSHWD
jgi:hypothetical protein